MRIRKRLCAQAFRPLQGGGARQRFHPFTNFQEIWVVGQRKPGRLWRAWVDPAPAQHRAKIEVENAGRIRAHQEGLTFRDVVQHRKALRQMSCQSDPQCGLNLGIDVFVGVKRHPQRRMWRV